MRTSDPRLVPKFGSFTPNGWILCGTQRNSTLDRLDLDCLKQTFKQPRCFKTLVMSFTVRPVFSLP